MSNYFFNRIDQKNLWNYNEKKSALTEVRSLADNNQTNQTGSTPPHSKSSAGTTLTFILIIIIVFMVLRFNNEYGNISWSTVQRNKYEGASAPTEYYTDETGNYITDADTLEEAVYTFYGKTGIPMYIYILEDDESIESYSDLYDTTAALYDGLFDDEEHFLVTVCYNGEEFIFDYIAGDDASSVMDADEAIVIFDDCIALYFDADDITDSLSQAVTVAAKHIMQTGNMSYRIAIIIAIIIAAIIYLAWRYKTNGGNWHKEEKTADGRTIIKFKRY